MLLVADSVVKSFGGRRVLTAGSLRAVPGQVRVLLGHNGAGKSTLLKIAAGRIRPDGGTVRYGDERFTSVTLTQLARRGVFYLPDHDLFSSAFTVRTQLEMIRCQFHGASVEDAAARMGIADRLDQRPRDLSSGETRRAELAAVLVRQPLCLLADEPFRGIAPTDAEDLTRTLRNLAESGVAVVATGHEVLTLMAAADHITWCTAGTTHELGPPAQAELHDQFRREYLGPGSLLREPWSG